MSRITVVKFVAGKQESSFSVPAFLLNIAHKFLPNSAVTQLVASGINVEEILQAKRLGTPYSATVEVVERGIPKTVQVSVA